jgi:hypothetical protein
MWQVMAGAAMLAWSAGSALAADDINSIHDMCVQLRLPVASGKMLISPAVPECDAIDTQWMSTQPQPALMTRDATVACRRQAIDNFMGNSAESQRMGALCTWKSP